MGMMNLSLVRSPMNRITPILPMNCVPIMKRPQYPKSKPQSRRAFTLFEIFVAVLVFGSVLTTFIPLMRGVHNQQRDTDLHLLAIREADNVMEELSQWSWQDLVADKLSQRTLSDTVKSHLRQPKLRVTVEEQKQTDVKLMKRVVAEITWLPHIGQPTKTVRLVAWFLPMDAKPNAEVQP